MKNMTKQFSEEDIQKALEYLKKKRPEHATREQAISLLKTTQNFSEMFVGIAKQHKKVKEN